MDKWQAIVCKEEFISKTKLTEQIFVSYSVWLSCFYFFYLKWEEKVFLLCLFDPSHSFSFSKLVFLFQLRQYQYYSTGLLSNYDKYHEHQKAVLGPKKKISKDHKKKEKRIKGTNIVVESSL